MDRLDYLNRDSFFTGVAEGGSGMTALSRLRCMTVSGGRKRNLFHREIPDFAAAYVLAGVFAQNCSGSGRNVGANHEAGP
jgi:HD superfamily phosphohydrolase